MKEEEKLIYLYESYKSLLLKITFQILNDEYLAEDAVHEAFIKVSFHLGNIINIKSKQTKHYLITIAKNTAIDIFRLRKRQLGQELYMESLQEAIQDEIAVGSANDEAILNLFTKLPVKYRNLFIMRYLKQMSYAEISKLLNVPEGTLRQRIARGKRFIQKSLPKPENE